MEQAHIFFKGSVQGVGFRYTAKSFARECHLTGWARNLPDGRVEIVAEGGKNDIDELCRLLEVQFEGFIIGKDVKFGKASGQFADFQIVH